MDKLRKNLDQIDKQILALIGKRVNIAKKIGKIKKQQKLAIADKKREKEIVSSLTKQAKKYKIDKSLIGKIWKLLFKLSYKVEEKNAKK